MRTTSSQTNKRSNKYQLRDNILNALPFASSDQRCIFCEAGVSRSNASTVKTMASPHFAMKAHGVIRLLLLASSCQKLACSIPLGFLQLSDVATGGDHIDHKCPPPQPCNCHCTCPEIIYPVPPPMPLLPTAAPMLLQRIRQSQELQATSRTAVASRVVGGHAGAATAGENQFPPPMMGMPPGPPVLMLPPPPTMPPPPMPQDWRNQPCPASPPCNCYCHCRQPPGETLQKRPSSLEQGL